MNGFFIRNIPDRSCLDEMADRHEEMNPDAAELYLHFIRFSASLGDMISRYLEAFDLSTGRMSILMMLHTCDQAAVTPGELADRCGVTAATISRLVESLIREGLVARVPDPDNRRISPVQLTEKGQDLLVRVLPDYFCGIGSIFGHFEERDRQQFLDYLNQLQTTLNQKETLS